MIFTWLIQLVCGFFAVLLNVLPTATWTPDMSGLGSMVGAAKAWIGVFPAVGAALAIIGIALAYHGASWLYHAANWVYRHLPFVGGG